MASVEARKSSVLIYVRKENVSGDYLSHIWASKTNLPILKDR